jgi:hypothetical protein
LIPAIVIGLILILTYAIMSSDLLRAVLQWLLFEPTYRPLEPEQMTQLSELKAKAEQALPIVLLIGYIGGSFALTYFSSMLLSQQYASRMNDTLPHPIFLQGDLLVRVVQEEIQRHLRQAEAPSPVRRRPGSNTEPYQTENALASGGEAPLNISRWIWENLERTNDGGIKLIAQAECEDSPVEETITGLRTKYPEFVSYAVRADRWGRIVSITRGARSSQYGATGNSEVKL